MENNGSQDFILKSSQWCASDAQLHGSSLSLDRMAETPILEETIAVVKEKVWGFSNVWKGIGEVLCGFGVSPTILGYSSVPLHDEGYIKERDEGEAALQSVANCGILSRKSDSGWSMESIHDHLAPEEATLLHKEEEEEDVFHAFAESARQELDEKKSLTSQVYLEDFEAELGEDKKSK